MNHVNDRAARHLGEKRPGRKFMDVVKKDMQEIGAKEEIG